MARKTAPDDPGRLPIKLGPASNGEFAPPPLEPRVAEVQRRAHAHATVAARRLGISRRDFLASSSGAATVLLALDASGCGHGRYNVPPEAATDRAAADEALRGDELIFDVQTHHVSTERRWWDATRPTLADFIKTTPQARCGAGQWVECFGRDVFLKEVFLDSDTRMGVVSALWGSDDINAIQPEEMALTRDRMAAMQGAPRLRIHGHVQPLGQPREATRDRMQALKERWAIAAWKLYPVWGPDGRGYRLDRGEGADVIARGLELGVPVFAVHKGLGLAGIARDDSNPLDVGPAAKMFPQATFLIYHSGYEMDRKEGPYDPTATRGVDALIRSLQEAGIGKDGNVYAELGSCWRECMKDPDQAAHLLGKLLRFLGEDRILWGTDAIWYGSPQDQILAFRTFEIGAELQERHGYPALTRQAKAKIFGRNALRVYGVDAAEADKAMAWDPVAQARAEYRHEPQPAHRLWGPRTRREVLQLLRAEAGQG
jgi:hypothetical protein